ncbi:Protein CBG27286 [Caenorhabditis briggsae]|uniref:Protein CBG27286 n=1 Tax=Caenorhabditis briggsae TaxID=6238 RepID=B6IE40_CAEBR|nr:Protein CBG27286 [Caenorhabditis briggsae]CAS01104.1 Protein CBG27286 [Caenorhabditis briggsae]
MLNSTCRFEDPFHVTVTHYLCALFSIPIYGISYTILLFKCPPHFYKYRNLLVIHITSGVLLEAHMGLWRAKVTFPWGALCANGLLAEYSPNLFQLWNFLFQFTAFSTVTLFVHRMEIVNIGITKCQKVVYFLRYAFYLNLPLLFVFNIFTYQDLSNQNGYKMKMEEARNSKIPDFMWCSNCFFMIFDSWIFIIYYCLAYAAVLCAFLTGGLAAFVTIRSLNSINIHLSERSVRIQKNFLYSLVVAAFIHIAFIFIPLSIFFAANFLFLEWSSLSHYLTFIVQEHGAASTLVMLITNTLLRKAAIQMCFSLFSSLRVRKDVPSIMISYVA